MDTLNPRCVASTNEDYNDLLTLEPNSTLESNFFRSAQFTPDGTTLLTHNQDQTLRAFVLPADLLSPPSSSLHRHLKPYTQRPHPTPLRTFTPHPTFNLSSHSTTLLLSAGDDVPIRLSSIFPTISPSSLLDATKTLEMTAVMSYSFVNPKNEAYVRPNSLAFTPSDQGAHFLAGAENTLALFDVEYREPTSVDCVSKRANKNNGRRGGWSGHVNALDVQNGEGGDFLAAGTTARDVMIMEREGMGRCGAVFNVGVGARGEKKITGKGITSLKWSPCGKLLLVAERDSDVVQVWDVRSLGKRVGLLTGRNARTLQRMGIDVVPTERGFDVWAGGRDGIVRLWNDAGSAEGERAPDYEVKLHEDAVSSAVWHPSGCVLATCSGQLLQPIDFDSDSSSSSDEDGYTSEGYISVARMQRTGVLDNSLKVWTV